MTITIHPIQVENLSTGRLKPDGNLPSFISFVESSNLAVNNSLIEGVQVDGTPTTINNTPLNPSADLYGKAHMGKQNILISPVIEKNIPTDTEHLYVPESIVRIMKINGQCKLKNSILYAFVPHYDTDPTTVTWKILMANSNSQTNGDYWDIPIITNYPNNFISFLIIPNGYTNKQIITGNYITFPSTSSYFCINPNFNTVNVNQSHTINIRGFNDNYGYHSRTVLCFEDRPFHRSDRDYNDVLIMLTSPSVLTAYINDIILQ